MKRESKKTLSAARWVYRWSLVAGVRADYVGMSDDGRARLRIDGGKVATLKASDVAEVIGERPGGARFEDSGALVVFVRVVGFVRLGGRA